MATRLTDDERRLRAISEDHWQARVLQHLRWNRWIAKHVSTSLRTINVRGRLVQVGDKEAKGLLDTFAVHPHHGWTLHLELKKQGPPSDSKVTPEQAAVIDALLVKPDAHRVAVLRPADEWILHRLATAPWSIEQKDLPTR